MDRLEIILPKEEPFRIYLVEMKETIEKARSIHGTTPLSTAVLGRVMIANALLLSMIKVNTNQRIGLDIECSGPVKRVFSEISGFGHIRAHILNPKVEMAVKTDDGKRKMDVAYAVGTGNFRVIKDIGVGEPYISNMPLVSGEIGKDLAYYLATSEQIPSAVSLGVMVEPDGRVSGGAGILVQTLPGASEEQVERMEKRFLELPPMSSFSKEAMPFDDILKKLVDSYEVVGKVFIEYRCSCNKDTVKGFILAMPKEDVEEMVREGGVEVECKYCRKKYFINREELSEILRTRKE